MKHRKNPLEIRLQAIRVPSWLTPLQYLRLLLRAVDTGELPRGVEVEIHWRNPATRYGRSKNWQSDEFTQALADSSSGFATAVRRTIQRKILEARGL